MLPKQAKFDLKCSKMHWRPRPRWGAYDAPQTPNREGNQLIINSLLRHLQTIP